VAYRLPGGASGRIADALLVRRLLRATFRSRQERTRALLESEVTRNTVTANSLQ
jgi:hypothetical protein